MSETPRKAVPDDPVAWLNRNWPAYISPDSPLATAACSLARHYEARGMRKAAELIGGTIYPITVFARQAPMEDVVKAAQAAILSAAAELERKP